MAYKARILIGDSNEETLQKLRNKLFDSGYFVFQATNVDDLLSKELVGTTDVVLFGQFEGFDQLEVLQQLMALHAPLPLPCMLFNCESSHDFRNKAIESKVQDIIEGVPDENLIVRRINLLSRLSTMQLELARRTQTAAKFGVELTPWQYDRFEGKEQSVLLLHEEDDDLSELCDTIRSFKIQTATETDFYRAADRLDAERFDACVIKIKNPENKEKALYLSSHLRNNPRQFNMPLILMANANSLEDEDEGYRAGITIVLKDCDDLNLIGTHCKLMVQAQRHKWSMRDPMMQTLEDTTSDKLHGVYSRAFFEAHLDQLIQDTSEKDGELSIAVFAIRNAPDVKLRFGEEACEMLLQQMADWIQGLLRIEDLTARISEFEFAVTFPSTSHNIANMVANRIAGILHHSEFRLTYEIMEAINVWVDLGVCDFQPGDMSVELIERTKKAIY